MNLIDEQVRLENQQYTQAKSKVVSNFQKMTALGKSDVTAEGIALQKLGVKRLTVSVEEYLSASLRGRASLRRKPLMHYKGKESELSYLILQSVIGLLISKPMPSQKITRSIIHAVSNALLLDTFKAAEPKLYAYIEYEYKKRGVDYVLSRKKRLAQLILEEEMEQLNAQQQGVALLEVLVNANIGLLERFTRGTSATRGKKSMYFYRLTDEARKVIENVQSFIVKSSVQYKPLVIPPKDWSNEELGGYHYVSTKGAIKFKTKKQREIFKEMLFQDDVDLSRFFNVLNKVQKTEWRVNTRILKAVKHITENNIRDYSKAKNNFKCIAGIPYQEYINVDDLIQPESYGEVEINERGFKKHKNREDYTAYYSARESILSKLEASNSRRIMYAIAVNLAEEFSKYDRFYYSYKADFRGRLYPMQQVFNPQATGNVKALLEFANGVVPTKEGMYWLKVGVANTAGHDKIPYDDRVKWVDDNMDKVLEAGKDPFLDTTFWSEQDEPLMFLSGCMAISDALEGKEVHYPVPLDATCSGIQMYSGLLMDEDGARAVNVINNDTGYPADIYKDVAEVVERRLMSGDYPKEFTFTDSKGEFREIKTDKEATGLKGNITRKLTKRNVMTQPYSVTQRGMYNQLRELFDEMEDNDEVFWQGEKWVSIKLLTHLNTQSIFEVVKGAIVGQEYIKEITSVFNGQKKPLVWRTPLFNFPVIQANVKRKSIRIQSPLGQLKFNVFSNDLDLKRQSNSIAPNFIHSLDATLMFLTVEQLANDGISCFSLIHDSFAVNCNAVPQLNKAVRDSYVELFMSIPLIDWYEQLQKQTTEELRHPDEVIMYTLDITDVWKSEFIFS